MYYHSSNKMFELADNTVHRVMTSPPYCMIPKWDNLFTEQIEEQRKYQGNWTSVANKCGFSSSLAIIDLPS
jgi:DNA modification methylase